ncbi:RDD family protein [Frateuria aurantia]|uniref:Putative membrane protein/domain protein n=1 Tax=Frateuria aurantia (strain ATCC 33424 / DSM 6220 / KCTC 2777 / LMG 1558 / NBRC 3245 / NCIMB 13370) TaxID=767434 RepID=H8L625_FRAAD|nr:RDD family protein [Frateuria aurantia]AFC86771.1 putative membrane protein/domain protein [Frateuria aurantia DSM 6220]
MKTPPPRRRLLRQIAAAAYDLLVCTALLAASGLMAQLATHGRLFDAAGHLRHAWFRPLQAGVIAAYLLLSWSRGGQTLGLRAWKLRLVSADGGPTSGWQRGWRLLIISLPWLALEAAHAASLNTALTGVALLWTLAWACGLIDPDRCAIQDRLAGTRMHVVNPRLVQSNPVGPD